MKKLIFILLLFSACKKDNVTPASSVSRPSVPVTVNTVTCHIYRQSINQGTYQWVLYECGAFTDAQNYSFLTNPNFDDSSAPKAVDCVQCEAIRASLH